MRSPTPYELAKVELSLRKNEADKRFLIKRIKRIAIHSQLESTRDSAVKCSLPRQLLPNSDSDRNGDVSNCKSGRQIHRSSMQGSRAGTKRNDRSDPAGFAPSFDQ